MVIIWLVAWSTLHDIILLRTPTENLQNCLVIQITCDFPATQGIKAAGVKENIGKNFAVKLN